MNEAKYISISHVACEYTFIKSTAAFLLYIFMPRVSEHEQSGAIEMLKTGLRVSDVARYHNYHPSAIQRLKDHYQATGTVKY